MTIAMEERKPTASSVGVNVVDTQGFTRDDMTPVHGISIWVAALFVLGALAGAGIVAMPNAFLKAGWWAVPLVIIMSVVGCLTGFQLSWCWTMLQLNWPEYSEHTRNPYPEIAYRAGGKPFKYLAQSCVNLSMFGGAIAFIILSANNISHLIHDWFEQDVNYCYMVIIVGGCMLPILFLGTPKDFWLIAVGAIGATAAAIAFIMLGTIIDMPACENKVHYPPITFQGFISTYCTICFAYGGHAAFPTIQHDMKQPAKFPISVLISFIALFILYFPMPVLSYLVYGHTVQGTIEANLSTKWIRDIIMVLITGHVLFAFFIVISPVVQDLERVIGIPLHFSWKRVCTRTLAMGSIIFIALSIPDFNALLELVGGTTLAMSAYVLPGPFYIMLRAKVLKREQEEAKKPNSGFFEWKRQTSVSSYKESGFFSHISPSGGSISRWEIVLNIIIVTIGLLGAVASVYGVLHAEASMAKPCYLTNMHLEPKSHKNITKCWEPDRPSFANLTLLLHTEH